MTRKKKNNSIPIVLISVIAITVFLVVSGVDLRAALGYPVLARVIGDALLNKNGEREKTASMLHDVRDRIGRLLQWMKKIVCKLLQCKISFLKWLLKRLAPKDSAKKDGADAPSPPEQTDDSSGGSASEEDIEQAGRSKD